MRVFNTRSQTQVGNRLSPSVQSAGQTGWKGTETVSGKEEGNG